jgi:hypothetical protein
LYTAPEKEAAAATCGDLDLDVDSAGQLFIVIESRVGRAQISGRLCVVVGIQKGHDD